MPKQDLLDNCVWLLYRSLKWNIKIDSNNREVLKQKAKELIQEIFDLDNIQDEIGDGLRKNYGNILQLYYYSWMLREMRLNCIVMVNIRNCLAMSYLMIIRSICAMAKSSRSIVIISM